MTDLQIVLGELRTIGERLARVETHVETIVGNTQPGRLTLVENKVSDLQKWRWRMAGIASTVGAGFALLLHFWK